jgi:TolB protein
MHRCPRPFSPLCLILAMVAPCACQAALICSDTGTQDDIAADGYYLVWKDSTGGGNIMAYNFLTDTKIPICTDAAIQASPDISGDIVVWQDNRNGNLDIYAYDISDANEFAICLNSAEQRYPQISGNIVIWRDYRNGNYDIMGYNLQTRLQFPICTNTSKQDLPAIDGSIVVWEDSRNGNKDIYAYDLSTQTEFAVCTNASDQTNPSVSGNIIAWEDSRGSGKDIYGYNLTTQTESAICTSSTDQTYPSVCDSVVVWQDMRSGNGDVMGYNLGTKTEFTVASGTNAQTVPAAGRAAIAWSENTDVYAIIRGDDYQSAPAVYEDMPFNGSTTLATASGTVLSGLEDTYDVWHILEPPRTGYYDLSLCGSSFDTTLAIYNHSMTLIASNDDSCGWASALTTPKLSPALDYYIRVSGYGSTQGSYTLTIHDSTACANKPLSDLNGDCAVNFADYSIMASEWLVCGKTDPASCQ